MLGRTTDLLEPDGLETPGVVAEPVGRPVACRRDRDRRNLARHEWRLLVAAVGETQVEELAEGADARRLAARFGGELCPDRLDEAGCRGPRRIAVQLDPRGRRPGDRVEVQHGDHVLPLRRVGGKPRRTDPAVDRPVGRDELDRVRQSHAGASAGGRVGARELE